MSHGSKDIIVKLEQKWVIYIFLFFVFLFVCLYRNISFWLGFFDICGLLCVLLCDFFLCAVNFCWTFFVYLPLQSWFVNFHGNSIAEHLPLCKAGLDGISTAFLAVPYLCNVVWIFSRGVMKWQKMLNKSMSKYAS